MRKSRNFCFTYLNNKVQYTGTSEKLSRASSIGQNISLELFSLVKVTVQKGYPHKLFYEKRCHCPTAFVALYPDAMLAHHAMFLPPRGGGTRHKP